MDGSFVAARRGYTDRARPAGCGAGAASQPAMLAAQPDAQE